MKQNVSKERLMEVMSKLDKTFKPRLDEMNEKNFGKKINEGFEDGEEFNIDSNNYDGNETDINLNEYGSNETDVINKYVMFAFNYPRGFIDEIWGDSGIANHLKEKFSGYYSQVGSNAVMNKFYAELDTENKKKLNDYIINVYQG